MRTIRAVSTLDGAAQELITLPTFGDSGFYYIRVFGKNGGFSLNSPFQLEVTTRSEICVGVVNVPLPLPATLPALPAGKDTLIIYNNQGIPDFDSANFNGRTMTTALAALAAHPQVNGALVNIGGATPYPALNQARTQSVSSPGCPYAKNQFAAHIKQIVDSYRAANPGLKYVVLAGGDLVIPFFRYPDGAKISPEKEYIVPVSAGTTSEASLSSNLILSDDAYGSLTQIDLATGRVPFPELGVGRLVERAGDMLRQLDAFLGLPAAANGIVTPQSALITSYGFLEDGSLAVRDQLRAGLPPGSPINTSLLQAATITKDNPLAWTAAALRTQLLQTRRSDLVYMQGHFSGLTAVPANERERVYAYELAQSSLDFRNVLIFSNGCHAGYNVVDDHAASQDARQPDWAQAAAFKGAVFIGGTGYQYGDADYIEWGERLYLEFAKQLRAGSNVPVGVALAKAKQQYLATITAEVDGEYQKTALIPTLYGLPMLRYNLILGAQDSLTPLGGSPSLVPTGDGRALGLNTNDVAQSLTLSTETLPLTNIDAGGGTSTATFVVGKDGVTSRPGEPLLPLAVYNASPPAASPTGERLVLRGVGFRSATYNDALSPVQPLVSLALSDSFLARPIFASDIFYPVQPWTVNQFGALANTAIGITRLNLTPAQFKSSAPGATTGTIRRLSQMGLRLYYSATTGSAALVGPPSIIGVTSDADNSSVTFRAYVAADPAAGLQEVWATYTAEAGNPWYGQWSSINLVRDASDPTLWAASIPLAGNNGSQVRFMIQAANGVGLVSSATNNGAYYNPAERPSFDPANQVPPPPAVAPAPVALALQAPASGVFGDNLSVSATLSGPTGTNLAGRTVSFSLNGRTASGLTNAAGTATASFNLSLPPGDYVVQATFDGAEGLTAAQGTRPLTIVPRTTTLTLTPNSQSAAANVESGVSATLTDSQGLPLGDRPVRFELRQGASVGFSSTVSTDSSGVARLGIVSAPGGNYTLVASFDGATGYSADSDTGSLRLYATATVTTSPVAYADKTQTTATLRGTVNANNDTSTAFFEIRLASGSYGTLPNAPITVIPIPRGLTPVNVSANVSGLWPGTLYTFRLVAQNAAGTTRGPEVSFRTRYNLSGFFGQIKAPPKLNRVTAGTFVPLRFSLGGFYGGDIFEPGFPQVNAVACPNQPETPITETAPGTGPVLIYNEITGNYIYIWKTERAWRNSCRELVMRFNDGSELRAIFRMR